VSGTDSVSDAVAHAVRAVHDDLAGCLHLADGGGSRCVSPLGFPSGLTAP
jgi:hypothetical protein